MSDGEEESKSTRLAPGLRDMKLEEAVLGTARVKSEGGGSPQVKVDDDAGDSTPNAATPSAIPPRLKAPSKSLSPAPRKDTDAPSPANSSEEMLGGDITLKMEPGPGGRTLKLARSASHKVAARPLPLYLDLPDATEESRNTFVVLPECTYANKHIGTTDPALECDCSEEWDSVDKANLACGEDSDCINRATKMECVGDCSCGRKCQNQRFLRKQYADVSVIKTDKKGYGLRANKDMTPGQFVFEYIGEVIDERTFRRRMIQYDQDGIKHFYFMSLTKGEFVDATKKGNLGRFCNHSCNPNCFVDKWVVGDKLRMGIFTERRIKAGEELVFNYNVDRYGADPQPCYCGEPNCSGFIGGKTQSDNATKLSHATIEALGIDDGDGWDTAVAKKPRKKKTSEDDEEYVNNLQTRSLEDEGVPKVMAALRQCTEKWIAVKLLGRIQQSDNERVGHRMIRMHGYETFKKTLTTWMDDFNVVLQVLDIMHQLPRITRNKIQDSKIEEVVHKLKTCGDERVEKSAESLLAAWSKLELAYRIPRMKRDPNASTPARTESHFERREKGRERSKSRSKSPSTTAPKGPSGAGVPSGPRPINAPKGPSSGFSRLQGRRPYNSLPAGWFQAISDNGSSYYYNSAGTTQWQWPTQPAHQPPPPPPKNRADTQTLQDIITSITASVTPTVASASTTPQPPPDELSGQKSRGERWRTLSQDRQEKLYESTLSPHIMSVAAHYSKKLEREDLKRLCKEVAKKLVRGDYRSGRVKDPTAKLCSRHEKTVKNYVKEYLDKAVKKKEEREKAKAGCGDSKTHDKMATPDTPHDVKSAGSSTAKDESEASPNDSSMELKRKRNDEEVRSPRNTRTRIDEADPAPPPPPPPPAEDMPTDAEGSGLTPMDDGSFGSSTEGGNGVSQMNGVASPMQLGTPGVNGVDEEKPNGSRPQY